MRTKWVQMSTREAMIELAGKPGAGEQPRWLKEVARAANISTRHARDLWRGYISDHNHRSAVAVRNAIELKRARAEKAALEAQLQTIVGGLNVRDPDFHREDVASIVVALRALRGLDRAGT